MMVSVDPYDHLHEKKEHPINLTLQNNENRLVSHDPEPPTLANSEYLARLSAPPAHRT